MPRRRSCRNPSLRDLLAESPFQAYSYSYPHKTAYGPLTPPRALADVWRDEDRSALFLYVHIPFCEQRCGFCNLYTQVEPAQSVVEQYLAALERQAKVVARAISPMRIARMAIGGGTPTWLPPAALERVFAVCAQLGAAGVPCSIEGSPATVDEARVEVLSRNRVSRVSVGVQSIFAEETQGVGRRQTVEDIRAVVTRLAAARIPTVNVDLMYGLPGQTEATLLESIDRVIEWGANELYLYPLYVRPLTRLGRRGEVIPDARIGLYRSARAHLAARGFSQISMRMFRSGGTGISELPSVEGAPYRCQADGMIGLGPGARSYTRALHYSSPYAVAQSSIRAQIVGWSAQSEEDFATVRHGLALSPDEQRRRFVILSVLERGLVEAEYRAAFGGDAMLDLPELGEAIEAGLIVREAGRLRMTEAGLSSSDVLGRFLYSPDVTERMASWRPA